MARRLSATSIEMSWDPISVEESRGIVIAFSVRYRKVERVSRRNVDDISTVVETTNTSIIITDLEPDLRYTVSVAAKTSVGIGNYSEEITFGCKQIIEGIFIDDVYMVWIFLDPKQCFTTVHSSCIFLGPFCAWIGW